MTRLIFFDLEGPLSPQDNAYEVMGLVPDGHRLFEVISRYDDLLTLEGREGYEPGDTLRLIVPFLVRHGLTTQDVLRVSATAGLVPGARELIVQLRATGCEVHIVSTSYEQHAHNIGGQLGLAPAAIHCTRLPFDLLRARLTTKQLGQVQEMEQIILRDLSGDDLSTGTKDALIHAKLDAFYWGGGIWDTLALAGEGVTVVGGRRKAWAMESVAQARGISLRHAAFIGDSITDVQGARTVESLGGLAIAFNANAFLLPHVTLAVAATRLDSLSTILEAWSQGGRGGVKRLVQEMGHHVAVPAPGEGAYVHWIVGREASEVENVIELHRVFRRRMREAAAKLG
jgi:energy-converting hydrogenase A subunit R